MEPKHGQRDSSNRLYFPMIDISRVVTNIYLGKNRLTRGGLHPLSHSYAERYADPRDGARLILRYSKVHVGAGYGPFSRR